MIISDLVNANVNLIISNTLESRLIKLSIRNNEVRIGKLQTIMLRDHLNSLIQKFTEDESKTNSNSA